MYTERTKKYLGKRYILNGREIELVKFISCYDGDFFYYFYTDDVEKKTYHISIFDMDLMEALNS